MTLLYIENGAKYNIVSMKTYNLCDIEWHLLVYWNVI